MRRRAAARAGRSLGLLGLTVVSVLLGVGGCGGGDPAAVREAAKEHAGRNKEMDDFMKGAAKGPAGSSRPGGAPVPPK